MPPAHDIAELVRRFRRALSHPGTRTAIALAGVACGGGIVVFTMAVGHCGFMGGTCPTEPVPWWQDDVFGSAAAGLVLAGATPLLAWRPDRRGLAFVAAAVAVVLPLAWLLAEGLRTGSA